MMTVERVSDVDAIQRQKDMMPAWGILMERQVCVVDTELRSRLSYFKF